MFAVDSATRTWSTGELRSMEGLAVPRMNGMKT